MILLQSLNIFALFYLWSRKYIILFFFYIFLLLYGCALYDLNESKVHVCSPSSKVVVSAQTSAVTLLLRNSCRALSMLLWRDTKQIIAGYCTCWGLTLQIQQDTTTKSCSQRAASRLPAAMLALSRNFFFFFFFFTPADTKKRVRKESVEISPQKQKQKE